MAARTRVIRRPGACRRGRLIGVFLPGRAGYREAQVPFRASALELRRVVGTLLSVWGRRPGDIGQLADVAAVQGLHDGAVEIRIVLDRVEPPSGRLRVVSDPGHDHCPEEEEEEEIRFTGWLGLLRALYEVTGVPGSGPADGW